MNVENNAEPFTNSLLVLFRVVPIKRSTAVPLQAKQICGKVGEIRMQRRNLWPLLLERYAVELWKVLLASSL